MAVAVHLEEESVAMRVRRHLRADCDGTFFLSDSQAVGAQS